MLGVASATPHTGSWRSACWSCRATDQTWCRAGQLVRPGMENPALSLIFEVPSSASAVSRRYPVIVPGTRPRLGEAGDERQGLLMTAARRVCGRTWLSP